MHMRRANLDALWALEPSTVEANRRQHKHSIRANDAFGVDHKWDRLSGSQRVGGAHPVEDTWGMYEACSILLRSMDPGRTSAHIQHDTMRKLRSHYSNRFKAYANLDMILMSEELGASFLTSDVRFGLWSKRFSQGIHSRMGDNPRPNSLVTVDEIQCIQTLLEDDWKLSIAAGNVNAQLTVATNAVTYISGFVGGLRGEEIFKLLRFDIKRLAEATGDFPTLPWD